MTAVVPVLVALEPLVAPLVLKLIDKIFPHGSGATKLPVAVNVFQNIIDGLVKAGAAGQAPDAATITGWVQQLVASLNAQGALKGPDTVITPPFIGTVAGNNPAPVADMPTQQQIALKALNVLEAVLLPLGVK